MKMLEKLSSKEKLALGVGFVVAGYVLYRWQRDSTSSSLKLGTGKLPTQFGSSPGWLPQIFPAKPASSAKTPALTPQAQAAIAQNASLAQDELYRSQMEDLGGGPMPATSGIWGI